jgi:hypothetical protein
MSSSKCFGVLLAILLACTGIANAQQKSLESAQPAIITVQQFDQLISQLKAHEERIKELEAELAEKTAPAIPEPAASPGPTEMAPAIAAAITAPAPAQTQEQGDAHDHMVQLPGGGPVLRIRGFADFNFGLGTDSNALIFPLGAPTHTTFSFGEFDLFLSSKLSRQINFVSEVIIGSDETNVWGLDIERLQVTYKPSPYFEISGGRYHTSIGYYNTTFHHGTWFQTATGRPFMFFFEDSGGLLPVHGVGVTTTGLVPRTGRLNLHWIAEVSNGRSSDPSAQPAQNFLSDKNHKAFNVAAFVKPEWMPGLQVGGSYYRDRFVPAGMPDVNQSIGSFYAVYNNSNWESLNEIVLLTNHADGSARRFHSPMGYTQISRKFGVYRPYYRFQYVNVPDSDPINIFTGRYESHSVGLRMDFTDYIALKIQYNRLYQRIVKPENGLDMQMAFTF